MGDLQHSKLLVVDTNGRFPALQADGVFLFQSAALAVSANVGVFLNQNLVDQIIWEDGLSLDLGDHPIRQLVNEHMLVPIFPYNFHRDLQEAFDS